MFAASKTSTASSGYQISRSLRFNSADSAYLNRTPASASNRTTWTWSGWVKRSSFGTDQQLFSAGGSGAFQFLYQTSTDCLYIYDSVSSTTSVITTQVFRDPSAWYHVVLATDTTQATASNRFKLYINGSQITSFGTATYPAQNSTLSVNNTVNHSIGSWSGAGGGNFFSGYMTEVNFIDGQALTPSSFGETNSQTGVWQPKAYAGSYGTNGFYVNFSDNSNTTATTLGKDYSGNGNNWTPNNFSVASGVNNDSMVDTPTPYGIDTGLGGEVRGNYCTLNAISIRRNFTLTNGNLDGVNNGNNDGGSTGTIGIPTTGKWYWEMILGPLNGGIYLGYTGLFSQPNFPNGGFVNSPGCLLYPRSSATCFYDNTGSAVCVTETASQGDVYGLAYNADTGLVDFYKNGVKYTGYSVTVTTGITYWAGLFIGNQGPTASINFGQRSFAYPAPSGYKALCTQNLPTPTIGATTATQAGKFFTNITYMGTEAARSFTGVGFAPDMLWQKSTTLGYENWLQSDIVRGANKTLHSDATSSEFSNEGPSSFDSDGWSVPSGPSRANSNGQSYTTYAWKAGGTGVSNTAGSITSTVSANTTSGVSVVTYTGTGANATIGHGLGVAPSMIISKSRSNALDWDVYHSALGPNYWLRLNSTIAAVNNSAMWRNVSPTSTVWSIGTDTENNTNGATYVAYVFAEVAGFSKFGSYTGNGSSDGPFLYLGFTPKYIFIKQTSGAGTNWRSIVINTNYLSLNTVDAVYDSPPGPIRGVSNGVKIVGTGGDINGNSSTFIYAAFATNPFKYALAQPQ